jgi:hypothetical protein
MKETKRKKSSVAKSEPSAVMVAKTFRLHPDTCAQLKEMADREGLSQAKVIDHLVRLNEIEVKVFQRC